MKHTLRFEGFESLVDLEDDIMWALDHEDIIPHGEFTGTLVVTLEYFDEDDEEDLDTEYLGYM